MIFNFYFTKCDFTFNIYVYVNITWVFNSVDVIV